MRPISVSFRAIVAAAILAATAAAVLAGPGTAAAAAPGQLTQLAGASGCIAEALDPSCTNDGRALDGGNSFVVSPDGMHAYSTSGESSAVVIFDRDQTTGALTQKAGADGCIVPTGGVASCTTAGRGITNAVGIAISDDGENVYATGFGSGGVAIFDRDTGDGTLTQKADAAGCIVKSGGEASCTTTGRALLGAYGITVSPDDANVYVTSQFSNGVAIFDRDTGDGTLTQKAGAAGCIVPSGGDATCTTTGRALNAAWGVAVSPDGENTYVTGSVSGGVAIFDRDTGDGTLTQKAAAAGCIVKSGGDATCTTTGRTLTNVRGLAISPDGDNVYTSAQGAISIDGGLAIFDRDSDSGELTQQAGTAGCITTVNGDGTCTTTGRAVSGSMQPAVSPDGENVYDAAQSSYGVSVFDRDSGSGALTQKTGAAGCVVEGTDATCTNNGRRLDGSYWIALSPDGLNAYVRVFNRVVAIFKRGDSPPVCEAVAGVKVSHDQPTAIGLSCTDPDNDPVTLSAVAAPAHGSLGAIDQAGSKVTYTPTAGYVGPDSFTYRATGDGVDSAAATVSLDVEPKAPVPTGPTGPTGPADPGAAVLSGLALSPSTFRAASTGPSAAAKRPIGTSVAFSLDRAATVAFKVERQAKGRKQGSKCSVKRKRGKRCTTYLVVKGDFSRQGIAGRNSFKFSGRVGGKKLRPGKYRLVATPKAGSSSGKAVRVQFRIVR